MNFQNIYLRSLCAVTLIAIPFVGTGCANSGPAPGSAGVTGTTPGKPQGYSDNGGTGTGSPVSTIGPVGAGPAGSR